MRKIATTAVALLAMSCGAAFAGHGGFTIPGLVSANGSTGSEISSSRITVASNRANDIMVGGGKASMKVADISLDGTANVNSVNITGSKIRSSDISVVDNNATGVKAIGGTANVNSVNIN